MAGQVSKRWRSVVEMVHDKAWRSLNKAVHLKHDFIGPKYMKIGWVENEHSLNICKCINIARDLVFYDNIELMEADWKQVEKFSISDDDDDDIDDNDDDEDNYNDDDEDNDNDDNDNYDDNEDIIENEAYHVEEAEALIRLVAAGILTYLDDLTLANFDWTVVKNLSILFKIVNGYIYLILEDNISGDWPKSAFNHINCWYLGIKITNSCNTGSRIFTDADIESLNGVLNRVKEFQFEIGNGYGSFFPIIEKYDGKGKCHKIEWKYNNMPDEEFGLEFEKVKEWASSRGWIVEEYNDEEYRNSARKDEEELGFDYGEEWWNNVRNLKYNTVYLRRKSQF